MTSAILQNAFLPTQISSCTLWLDGADPNATGVPPASGSTVSTWRDKSSTANNFTGSATYTLDSVYNKYGLSFNGSTNYFSQVNGSLYSITNTTYTIFTVHRFYFDNPSNSIGEVYRRVSNGGFWFRQIGGGVQWFTDTSQSDPTGFIQVNGTAAALSGIGCINTLTTSSATAYLNGTSVGSAVRSTTTNIAFAIGHATVTELLQGAIFETIIYNTTLTTAQRQRVEGYLAWKWGLVANLPPTHPYKNTPAVIITQPSTLALLTVTNLLNNGLFLPTSIPGCQIWLDGADPAGTGIAPINGASISTWADKSGNAKSATATSGNATFSAAALNGRGVLAFGGAAYLTSQLTMATTTPLTYFAVARPNVTTNFYAVSAINGGPTNVRPNTLMLYKAYNDYWWFSGGTGAVDGNTVTLLSSTSRYDINANYWSPSYTQMNINGTSYASSSAAPTSLANGGTFLVGIASGLYEYWNGWIAELIIYNSALTTNQRQQIEGYLAWKWGLQANLPPTHPYKAAPFSPFSAVASVASLLNTNQLNSKLITNYFNPRSIAVTQLWLDAADRTTVVLSGTSVTQWNDKSGNVSNATGTGGLSYIPGQGITFNGTNGYFSVPGAANSIIGTPFTVFIVEKVAVLPSAGLPMGIFANDPNTGVLYGDFFTCYQASGAMTFGWYGADQTTSSTVTAGTTRLWNFNYTGSQRRILLNGTAVATESWTQNLVTGAFTQPVIGRLWGTYYYNGTISELILYVGNINNQQCQQVEGYLAWKWGLQANLPATHPYKLFPPSPN